MRPAAQTRPRIVVVGSIVFDCVAQADRLHKERDGRRAFFRHVFGRQGGQPGPCRPPAWASIHGRRVGRVHWPTVLKNLNASGVVPHQAGSISCDRGLLHSRRRSRR